MTPDTPDATPAGPPPAADEAGERTPGDRWVERDMMLGYPMWLVYEWGPHPAGHLTAFRGQYDRYFIGGAWTEAEARLLAFGGPRLAALEAACRAAEDALVVAKQQIEFRAGRRQRGWDQAFVFERINTALVALALGAAGPGGAT